MLYSKMVENESKTRERLTTSKAYAYANAIIIVVALMCLYFEDSALSAVVLIADLVVFVAYLVMMALI